MKILRLARARVLLWAWKPGDDVPFEVSRVVDRPLQERCPTAPACPGEEDLGPEWMDPFAPPSGKCPYDFELRGQCLDHRNQLALEAALFRPNEAERVRRLLEAMGYEVSEEPVDPVAADGERILDAHGFIGADHEVHLLRSPVGGEVVLVRDRQEAEARQRGRGKRRARPIGGGS